MADVRVDRALTGNDQTAAIALLQHHRRQLRELREVAAANRQVGDRPLADAVPTAVPSRSRVGAGAVTVTVSATPAGASVTASDVRAADSQATPSWRDGGESGSDASTV